MRSRFIRNFVFLAIFLWSSFLYAEPKLDARLSASQITQDRSVILTLQIEWPKAEGSYVFVAPQPHLENLSLVRRGESQEFFTRESFEWSRKTFEFELKPLGPGNAEIHPFNVTYVHPVTQEQGNFQVAALPVRVENHRSLNPVWALTIGGTLVMVIAAGISHFFRKKKLAQEQEILISQEEKKTLKIKSIMESGVPSKEIFHQITSEFRHFLEDYYKIGRSRTTEDEIIQLLKLRNVPHEEWQRIKSLLEKVREAKYLPEQSAVDEYQYLEKEILDFIESKKSLEPFPGN